MPLIMLQYMYTRSRSSCLYSDVPGYADVLPLIASCHSCRPRSHHSAASSLGLLGVPVHHPPESCFPGQCPCDPARSGSYSLAVQCGQRWCIRLISPQAGHLHRELTSFNALPAICLCLFFMCDVFFLGTAFRIDSQMSSRMDGIDGRPSWKPTGTASVSDGKRGRESCRTWSCSLVDENSVVGRSLGRKELNEAILMAGAANAISNCGREGCRGSGRMSSGGSIALVRLCTAPNTKMGPRYALLLSVRRGVTGWWCGGVVVVDRGWRRQLLHPEKMSADGIFLSISTRWTGWTGFTVQQAWHGPPQLSRMPLHGLSLV